MEKSELKDKIGQLEEQIGYKPYVILDNGKVHCRCCESDFEPDDKAFKVKTLKNKNGETVKAHSCPECQYMNGMNTYLKKRITEKRRLASLNEYPKRRKESNKYIDPDEVYKFLMDDPESKTGVTTLELREVDLDDIINGTINEPEEPDTVEETKEEEVVEETTEETSEVDEAVDALMEDDDESTEGEETVEEVDEDTDTEEDDEEVIAEAGSLKIKRVEVEDIEESEEETTSSIISKAIIESKEEVIKEDDNDSLFGDLIGAEEEKVEEQPQPEVVVEEKKTIAEDSLFGDLIGAGPEEHIDDSVIEEDNKPKTIAEDSLFGDLIGSGEEPTTLHDVKKVSPSSSSTTLGSDIFESLLDKPQQEEPKFDFVEEPVRPNPGNGFTTKNTVVQDYYDPIADEIIKINGKDERNVFDMDNAVPIGKVIKEAREEELRNIYKRSEFAKFVEGVHRILKTRADNKKNVKYNVTINGVTHECPVVDFIGGIRFIYIDLDVPGVSYDIVSAINRNLYFTFPNDEFVKGAEDIQTIAIYSDQVKNHHLHSTIQAAAKILANKIKERVFKTVWIEPSGHSFYYTTGDNHYDAEFIDRFRRQYSGAGIHKKPRRGEKSSIALLVEWIPENFTNVDLSNRFNNNMAKMENGEDLDFQDISLYAMGVIDYFYTDPDENNEVHVVVTNYVESSEVNVADGFGLLVGILHEEISLKFPNAIIHYGFEYDISTLPSPTLLRYKDSLLVPVEFDNKLLELDNISRKVSEVLGNEYGDDGLSLKIRGSEFKDREHISKTWVTYAIKESYRTGDESDHGRRDYRELSPKNFFNTLGERARPYSSANVKDKQKRNEIFKSLGGFEVYQPPVISYTLDPEGVLAAHNLAVGDGVDKYFSLGMYVDANKSRVVNSDYMNNPNNRYIQSRHQVPQGYQYNNSTRAMYRRGW